MILLDGKISFLGSSMCVIYETGIWTEIFAQHFYEEDMLVKDLGPDARFKNYFLSWQPQFDLSSLIGYYLNLADHQDPGRVH